MLTATSKNTVPVYTLSNKQKRRIWISYLKNHTGKHRVSVNPRRCHWGLGYVRLSARISAIDAALNTILLIDR
jgi:hypothetical protein